MKVRNGLLVSLILMMFFIIGCSPKETTPESVAAEFWQAVIDRDMEKAKNMATWDSVDYLKYIRSGQLKPERYELGEVMKGERSAVIETTLYSQPQGQASVRIPGKTALVSTEHGWRVDLKQTIGSTLKETVGTVFDQLNDIMQEGLKGFDQQLSDSVKEIGKALEKGAEELRDELSKQPFGSQKPELSIPEGQQI